MLLFISHAYSRVREDVVSSDLITAFKAALVMRHFVAGCRC